MTSRERVLAAVEHREPDRVPVDLGGSRVTSINPLPYEGLRAALGVPGEPVRVIDVWQMLVWIDQPVVEKLGLDVLPVPRLFQDFGMRIDRFKPWRLDGGLEVQMPANFAPVEEPDGALSLYLEGELVARKAPSSPFFDRMVEFKVYDPLPPVESFPMALFTDEDLAWRRRWASTLRAETDKATMGEFGPILGRWGSYQEWLMTVAADPEYVRAYYERKVENLIANAGLYLQAVGSDIDIVWFGEDFGTQSGLMIAPEVFSSLVAPYYGRLFDWIHAHTPWKVFFHCCGGIYPIIPTLISIGVDILNPVQVEAAGMQPQRLKREFGDRLTFWGGGIDTQTVLPFGTPEQIQTQVRERLRIFAPGGGYVFTPSHNIQEDVSWENLLTMYAAVRDFGVYPV
jgi:uroporphyrinogen decarboxylase